MKKKILAISGSTRKSSSNEAILKAIAHLYHDRLEVDIYNGIDKLPHFNPDQADDPPAPVKDLQQQLKLADGVIICTPEYVFSLPGSLKNAIEWQVATTIFSQKPVGFIVASASGEKAFESLELILTTIEAKIPADAKLLIKGARGKIRENGEITDEHTMNSIRTLVDSLVEAIQEMAHVP